MQWMMKKEEEFHTLANKVALEQGPQKSPSCLTILMSQVGYPWKFNVLYIHTHLTVGQRKASGVVCYVVV